MEWIFTTFLAILFLGCLALSDTIDPTYNYAPIQRQRLVVGIRYQVKS